MNTTILSSIEIAGTMAFAISGIRLAASKRFDLFGAYVVGLVTAIGGGTIRDVLLGCTPVWMEQKIYLIVTAISLVLVIAMGRHFFRFESTFFIFDTIGLALFTIAGLEKSLNVGFPLWVAIIMGIVTGSFGGVMRDVLVGDVPLLFRRDIYALTSLIGGAIFALLSYCDVESNSRFVVSIASIIIMRLIVVRYHLHLPTLARESDSRVSLHARHVEEDADK